jgi:hypothetical protein
MTSSSPNENPYAPSMNLEQPATQEGKLFSPGQVALASFLGLPVAGCFLVSHNCRTLGQSNLVSRVWAIGIAITVASMALSMFVPDNFPNLPIPLALTIASFYYAKSLHGETYERHIITGRSEGFDMDCRGLWRTGARYLFSDSLRYSLSTSRGVVDGD